MMSRELQSRCVISAAALIYKLHIKKKCPLTARFLYTVSKAVKGHFIEFLVSNIIGYLSFVRV